MRKRMLVCALSLAMTLALVPAAALAQDHWIDPNPPTLSSISADRTVASFGDTVTFALDVADADGVKSVSVSMQRDSGDGYGDYSGSASWSSAWGVDVPTSGTVEAKWSVDRWSKPGRNRVESVKVEDALGYETTIYDAEYARQHNWEGPTADFSNIIVDLFDGNEAPVYKPLEVAEVIYHPGSGKGITIRFNAPFDKFADLEIDGKIVPRDKYTVREGSTIIEVSEDYIRDFDGGSHNLTARYTDGGKASSDFTVTATEANADMMFRLYNPNSGEHFYTASTVERDHLVSVGWQDEGIGWSAPRSGVKVYRLCNSFAGEHHYTMSEAERDMLVNAGWTLEEGGWYSDPNEAIPLYRAYNPNAYANNHHYTTDRGEFEILLSLGWRDEGVSWHGIK